MIRYQITAQGRVQRVGFRRFVQLHGVGCHLTGWVENLGNGDVEIEAQGEKIDVERFLALLYRGSFLIRVDHLKITEIPVTEEENFRIRN